MNIKQYCYVLDYNRCKIWYIDINDYITVPLNQYSEIDWEDILEEQGFNSDEIEYMISDKPLNIENWFN